MMKKQKELKAFVNYPISEEGLKILKDNLATFKAKLMIKSIENLTLSNEIQMKVFAEVIEILNERKEDDFI